VLDGYDGEAALMSFNPHTVKILSELLPNRPWGLVTEDFPEDEWPGVSRATRERLRDIPDFEPLNAGFISHDAEVLHWPRVAGIRAAGFPVLTWTIRSPEAESQARQFADNITFERYLPPVPAA
jgi:glycerophosphoryl diester phosphodiesterase